VAAFVWGRQRFLGGYRAGVSIVDYKEMHKMTRWPVLVALLALFPLPAVLAQSADPSPESLRGLKQLAVLMRPLDRKILEIGIRPEPLRTSIVKELESVGLAIVGTAEEAPAGEPWIEVTVTGVKDERGGFVVFDMNFRFRRATLVRRGAKDAAADSGWRQQWAGLVPLEKLSQVEEQLRQFARDFAAAWRSVNGPPAASDRQD
jgi:hypothetical protein